MKSVWVRRWIYILVVAAMCVVGTDRLALYSWQRGVIACYTRMSETVSNESGAERASNGMCAETAGEPVRIAIESGVYQMPIVEICTDSCWVKPSLVVSDGVGNIGMKYYPPLLAWSTRLYAPEWWGRAQGRTGSTPVRYYGYEIRLVRGEGQRRVELYRISQADPLMKDQVRARWFP
jgi:hypothetical protein